MNAIINCHLLTGRIGRPGMGPFSVTGQPNAMGGREVGGLANQLASHMDLENPDHRALVQRFWDSPKIADRPGLKAVDLFDAVYDQRVKALWIMGTNPVVSMPDADRVREGLRRCELVVVSDVFSDTDTARCADILLPSTAWGEKNGMVTNSERRMSRQRAFLLSPGEARDDWRQICAVAADMGWSAAFAYDGPDAIFREYAALCALENDGARDLDLAGLASLDRAGYDAFAPTQWPVPAGARGGTKRAFADRRFFTADGRANFVALRARPAPARTPDYPYTLNTGRIRDQWHTMTRTGRAPRLLRHIAEPFIEIAPEDAAREGLKDAGIARVVSLRGEMLARVLITDRQKPGALFAPMHWTDAFAAKGRVDALVAPLVDPVSGQPALKSARVRIEPYAPVWFGFAALATDRFFELAPPAAAGFWAKARIEAGARFELAGEGGPLRAIHRDLAAAILHAPTGAAGARARLASYADRAGGAYHYALYGEETLLGALYLAERPVAAARAFICELVGKRLSLAERWSVLAGRPGADAPDRGAIVCACLNVGANEIAATVKSGCLTAQAIGAATGAGTNCGACRSEIARFLPAREPVDA